MTRARAPISTATKRTRFTRDPVGRRAVFLLVVYVVAFVGITARLVLVQVVRADELALEGIRQRVRTVELPPQRGRIYDREGDVLATSVDAATVYADPRAYRPEERPDGLIAPPAGDVGTTAATLAPILGLDADAIATQLRKDAHFVYLARQLDWRVGEHVLDLGLPGIGVLTEPRRDYPAGGLAGQIVGFTGIDGDGLHGLELQYDRLLRGEPGTLALERAPGGLAIASGTRQLEPATAGTDLVLTIDREIQHVAETAAQGAVEEFNAVGASVVVLEVRTGDVLAMASAPGFDPDALDGSDPATWRNRAVTDMFEPGSVQKALTAAAALEEGVVTPDTVFAVEDRIRVGNKTFSDSHDHPTEDLTFSEIIAASSNVGTIKVAQLLGPERLATYLEAFGYGQPLGTGFPGEAPGMVLPVDQWWTTSLPTIAIGQGVAATLLQAAHAYATIANDGLAVPPRIVRGTVAEDGRLHPTVEGDRRRVIGAKTSRALREILAGVVDEGGTGGNAAVANYDVAGKTGTARKPLPDARGYSTEYVAAFVGFAPVDDPQVVVAVMVDEPRPIWGGVVAAPVFAEVMEFALLHRQVAPTGGPVGLQERFDAAAREAAEAAARQEGPATLADEPGSPPGGDPVETPDASTPADGAGSETDPAT
ncbi:MAG: penicillin-binding protein 2 [Actinobacteria bacterium]|nr:penicillin-binding protein 2 [Actinomycetota bacterium]